MPLSNMPVDEEDDVAPELSAFEKQRLETMKQNQAFLQRLGLGGSGLAAAAAGESAPPRCVYSSTVWCICERILCIRDRSMCIHIHPLERVRILRIHTIDIMVSTPACSVYTQSISCVHRDALCIHAMRLVYTQSPDSSQAQATRGCIPPATWNRRQEGGRQV